MTELTLKEVEMVCGGSDTVNGKVKFGASEEGAALPFVGGSDNSDTTTGTVK